VIEDDLSEQRDLIKKESIAILKSNGILDHKMTEENLVFNKPSMSDDSQSDLSNSSSMVEVVDSMLENVNRIMYQISDPGSQFDDKLVNINGEVKTVYDCYDTTTEDEEKEIVQNYLVFDQSTGKTSSIVEPEEKLSDVGECLFFVCFILSERFFKREF